MTGPVCQRCEKKSHKKVKKKASKTEQEYLKVIAKLRGLCYNSVVAISAEGLARVERDAEVDKVFELLKKKKYGAGLPFKK